MAALRGDEAAYQAHLAAAFNMIRTKVAPDGAILRNAERGDRAMLYQAIGILGIASLWDVIERQGGSVPPDIEAALHRAVGFFLAAEADISTILPYASAGYNNPGDGRSQHPSYRESPEQIWWMWWYSARFPDRTEAQELGRLISAWATSDYQRIAWRGNWVPYPVNCVIDANLEAVAIQGTEYAEALSVERAFVRVQYSEVRFTEFSVATIGGTLDGQEVDLPPLSVFADFRNSEKRRQDVELLRLVFQRDALSDPASRAADFTQCDPFNAVEDARGQQIRLSLYTETIGNICIMDLLGPTDRAAIASLMDSFSDVVAQAQSDAADELVGYLDWIGR